MAETTASDIIDDIKRVGSLLQLAPGAEFGRGEYLTHNEAKFTFYQMYDGAAVPNDVARLVGAAGQRMDVVLRISGYGNVALSVIVR